MKVIQNAVNSNECFVIDPDENNFVPWQCHATPVDLIFLFGMCQGKHMSMKRQAIHHFQVDVLTI